MRNLASLAIAPLALLAAGLLATPVDAQDDSPPPTDEERVVSGFLGDYSELQPHPKKGDDLLVYRKAGGVLGEYRAFLVDRPLVYFVPDSKGIGVDPAELQMLAQHLHDAVVAQLEKGGFQVAEEPGPGVLVLRTAITDVNPVNPAKNISAKVAGAAVGVGLLVPRTDLGGASIEVEMLDGESGERVAAVVASKRSRRFGGLIKGSKRWGDVKAAFESWAKQFRKQLEETREG